MTPATQSSENSQSSIETPIETFLASLSRQEIKLWLEGDRLRCSGPETVLTSELNAQLKSRKPEIIAFLRRASQQQATNQQQTTEAITVAERSQTIPLSFAQQRLWFLHQMQPNSAVYNLPMAIQVNGYLDTSAFSQSLNAIVRRHEILRTRFVTVLGEPIQQVAKPLPLEIEQKDLTEHEDSEGAVRQAAIAAAQQPFDLSQDQLLRVTLLKLSDSHSVILFTVHHIVDAGWSQEILIQELASFYRTALLGQLDSSQLDSGQLDDAKSVLPPLPIQYADFAIWQRNWLQGEVLDTQLDYWRNQLNASQSVLQLPTDFPRAMVQTYQGAVEQFSLSASLSDRLRNLAQSQSATLFMTLLAAFNVLLYRYTGETDLVVGTPIANRHRAEVEGLIGLFVNTLVLRSHLSPNNNITTLLNQEKTTTKQAYDHQ